MPILAALLLWGSLYAHFLAYAPPSTDRLADSTMIRDFRMVPKGGVVLFRGECLLENLLQACRLRRPVAITPDDDPPSFVDRLSAGDSVPERIVVVEDSSFFLFLREMPKDRGLMPDVVDHETMARRGRPYATYFDYVRQRERQRLRDEAQDLDGEAGWQSIVMNPVRLRRHLSQHAQRLVLFLIPARTNQSEPMSYFFRNYANYWLTGNSAHLFSAWMMHRQQFIFPAATRWARQHITRLDHLENRKPEPGYNCLHYSYATKAPPPGFDIGDYPVLRALHNSAQAGTPISLVLLPMNPEFERHCERQFAPYYDALSDIALRLGWPLHDLRSLSQPELARHGIFLDHMHVWTPEHENYFNAFTRLFAKATGLDVGPCAP